jgi:hypothetical protein
VPGVGPPGASNPGAWEWPASRQPVFWTGRSFCKAVAASLACCTGGAGHEKATTKAGTGLYLFLGDEGHPGAGSTPSPGMPSLSFLTGEFPLVPPGKAVAGGYREGACRLSLSILSPRNCHGLRLCNAKEHRRWHEQARPPGFPAPGAEAYSRRRFASGQAQEVLTGRLFYGLVPDEQTVSDFGLPARGPPRRREGPQAGLGEQAGLVPTSSTRAR